MAEHAAAGSDAGQREALDERLELGRREVVERVAVGQHQRPEALGMIGGHQLRERAAGVVADERDVVELEPFEQLRDQSAPPPPV